MAEVEVPPEAPAWMLALEKKRQRVHRLAHEVGAGSPCLLCQEDCPGLDLHFWRKICRNCKCKKEDHNVIDDCGAEQFEILLGSGHLSNRPNKAFLEMLEKHTSAKLKNQLKSFAFDWLPPDVSPVIAAEYMQSLPASKLPVSGSDGALYRRQQLERQLPLHDLDASQCHQLTDSEVDNLNKYLENLKNNVVGQGRVTKLHIPISNSLDSLSKIHTFNSVPKPFQSTAGDSLLSDARPQFDIGGHINSGNAVHLKPPSAFWPKSLSPEPNRSLSPGSESQLPSVADRGAAFGVTLSPAKGTRPLPKSKGAVVEPTEGSPNAKHGRLSPGRLVKEQTLKSVAVSKNVPGNMWVPSECPECTRQGADGELIVERVCTHIADSKNVPPLTQPSECTKCVQKIVDGKLVAGQVCPHISYSSDVPLIKQPSECTKCVKKIVDGRLVYDKVCPHVGQSSDVRHPIVPTECTQCSQKIVDGKLVVGQVCSHISSSTDVPLLKQPSECTKCVKKIVDGKLVCDEVCPNVSQSSDVAHLIKPAECTQCIQKIVDGKLVFGQVCPHVSNSSDLPHRMQPSDCTKCIKMGPDGKYIMDQNCPHILNAGDTFPSGLHPGHLRDLDVSESFPEGIPKRESSPIPPGLLVPGSTTEKQEWNSLPGLRVPSPLIDEKGTISRNRSPTSMMSSPGAPHTIALYAHNASSLDPQDTLSPHVAIMSLDDGKQSGSVTEPHIPQATDLTPVPDLNLHCAQCTQNISPGEVVVFADRAGPEVVWHPKCFVCNICQELLVDLVYFYNKGHVYCGRHYAEILDIPRCSACDELIFVKEYTVAEGQAFHVKHFCCFECDDPLGGKQYVPKDGQPICLPCYGKKYGKQCETCHTVIGAKDQGVTWKDLHWHATPDCFCCSFCQKSLLGGRFAVKDQKPFCCKECMQAGASSNHQKVSAV